MNRTASFAVLPMMVATFAAQADDEPQPKKRAGAAANRTEHDLRGGSKLPRMRSTGADCYGMLDRFGLHGSTQFFQTRLQLTL